MILSKYCSDIQEDLNLFKHPINENNLHTFSKVYDIFCLHLYFFFRFQKMLTTERTKIRNRAQDVLIERGRYGNGHISVVRIEESTRHKSVEKISNIIDT